MKKQEKKEYENRKPIAVYPMNNFGGIEILDIVYGIEDYVIYRWNFGTPTEVHKSKIIFYTSHHSFRTSAGYSVRLDECVRV